VVGRGCIDRPLAGVGRVARCDSDRDTRDDHDSVAGRQRRRGQSIDAGPDPDAPRRAGVARAGC